MSEYKIQFEVFEGPLDLLLYLIRKRGEVDIYDVDLSQIATQFLEYLEVMRQMDLEIAGEFLVVAATLMLIKSRQLLPVEQRSASTEEEEEGEDPRWELIRQLVEYKKFKEAAGVLNGLEGWMKGIYGKGMGKVNLTPVPVPELGEPAMSCLVLVEAVNRILKRIGDKVESTRNIFADPFTVSDKIEYLQKLIVDRMQFEELFEGVTTRSEVVATFLALLELVRLKVFMIYQEVAFDTIWIERRKEPMLERLEGPAEGT